ncbi:hypothetical protein DMC64_22510 [Amycolatopsis sp. WAC 04197]|nr:hypothetical protein DMC64_22510 [Amycolatopsis sp. WAC 04197]
MSRAPAGTRGDKGDEGGIVRRRDRRILQEIEEDLTASDPDLAAAFDQVKRSSGGQTWWAVLVVAEITALLMITVGLFSDRGLVFLAGVAAASALVWAHNTYRQAQRLPAWRSLR